MLSNCVCGCHDVAGGGPLGGQEPISVSELDPDQGALVAPISCSCAWICVSTALAEGIMWACGMMLTAHVCAASVYCFLLAPRRLAWELVRDCQ